MPGVIESLFAVAFGELAVVAGELDGGTAVVCGLAGGVLLCSPDDCDAQAASGKPRQTIKIVDLPNMSFFVPGALIGRPAPQLLIQLRGSSCCASC